MVRKSWEDFNKAKRIVRVASFYGETVHRAAPEYLVTHNTLSADLIILW